MDCLTFFYQWAVAKDDRHKLTINTHRGQESFRVAVMGYCNSVQYVQRQLDKILRPCREFARAYVDDIVIFSKTPEEHLQHLRTVFRLLDGKRISVSPKKTFLGYPSTTLLGQRVSGFGLATHEDRIAAILNIQFPRTLQALEHYLGVTGFIRDKIPYFSQIAGPLLEAKTTLLKGAPKAGKQRKSFAAKSNASDIFDQPELRLSFDLLQDTLRRHEFLYHYDYARRLYADIDSSYEWGTGSMAYMVEGDPDPVMDGTKAMLFPKSRVQPVLFLSRGLSAAEKNYWPTELEVSGIVWTIKKIHHLVHASQHPVTIFTDHHAAVGLANQHSLATTTCTDRKNLRLVRAAHYLSQFRLDVRYRPGRIHVIPDALSRLLGDTESPKRNPNADSLDPDDTETPCYHTILVELSQEFKDRLTRAYDDDPHWRRVMQMVLKAQARRREEELENRQEAGLGHVREGVQSLVRYNDGRDPREGDEYNSPLGLRFFERGGLLYYRDFENGHDRLCIPAALEQEIFQMAHDDRFHQGIDRCYDRIVASIYIHHLRKRLKTYIQHCSECHRNQTQRHQPYGELRPIQTPTRPMFAVAMDWVTALPETRAGLDASLTTTCKSSKRILLVAGRGDWTAAQWADAWLPAAETCDWCVPAQIFSDRDPKFMGEFWTALAKALKIKMLTSTAYHPQTDGQSERTNQTVEIALRYFLTSNPGSDFTDCFPHLQSTLNNSRNATTGYSPNEVVMGFRTNIDSLANLQDLPSEDFARLRGVIRREVTDAVAWANVAMKARYDNKHKPLFLRPGDKVMLRLHHGYKMLGHENRKFSHQREGPFAVKKRIGELAYELDLPPGYQIHPVVSVAQLEPLPKGPDPYNRPQEHEPGPVAAEADDAPEYEIEKLLGRRVHLRRGKPIVQYLVKWLGYGAVHNRWYDLDDLAGALDLVKAYDESNPPGEPQTATTAGLAPRSGPRRQQTRRARREPFLDGNDPTGS